MAMTTLHDQDLAIIDGWRAFDPDSETYWEPCTSALTAETTPPTEEPMGSDALEEVQKAWGREQHRKTRELVLFRGHR